MTHLKRIGLFLTLLAFGGAAAAQDDAAQGQKLFEAQCAACHTVKPGVNGFGPSLAGVFGRPAGKAPGYTYTTAMSNSGLTWDEKTLDAFLTSTTDKVPGTSMPVSGVTASASPPTCVATTGRPYAIASRMTMP